jgi:hypothetical protein
VDNKINCAIATRYDQLADGFLRMLYLASARYRMVQGLSMAKLKK